MADFPLQRRSPRGNKLEPTLLPNFSPNVASGHGLHAVSPVELVDDFAPRVESRGTLTLSGAASGGPATLTIQNGVLGGAPVVLTINTTSGETLGQVADAISYAINEYADLAYFGFSAQHEAGGIVVVEQPSSVGNFTTITWDAGATGIAVAITQMAGGSGAIIPLNNFNFIQGSANFPLWYGIPKDLSYATVLALVTQGMPVM